MLCLDTGERIGAVFASQWDWLEGSWIQFPAEVRKGGRRDRKYFLSSQTCGLLYRIRQCRADEERVFPWPYHPGYLWDLYRKILVAAGLPSRREDKFHRLRKTHASVLHQAGLDATKALDHQDRRTTDRYLDPRFCTDVRPSRILAAYLATPGTKPKRKNTG
jgi:integrase